MFIISASSSFAFFLGETYSSFSVLFGSVMLNGVPGTTDDGCGRSLNEAKGLLPNKPVARDFDSSDFFD